MRITSIFEKDKDRLFAVSFEEFGPNDELENALDFWRDNEKLREFFNHYRGDLAKFEPGMKVKKAVKQVSDEAEEIFDRLKEFSEDDKLDKLFKPLDNRELSEESYELQKLKAKGERRKSMLRLYAVKFGGAYIITGSAIKINDRMDGRPHLKMELEKLEAAKKFLQQGEDRVGSFVYLDI
jgi:hypothetical protein